MATKKAAMSDKDKKQYEYMGKHLARSPEYAKKQFGIKEGMHSKVPKAKKK